MNTSMSFAPLAGRLAAHAAEIRSMAETRSELSQIVALFVCCVLEMLICLCEALDAQAATQAGVMAAAAPRNRQAAATPALSSDRRAPRLVSVPSVGTPSLSLVAAPSGTTERPAPFTPWLAWSRNPGPIRAVLAPPWRPRRETTALAPAFKHTYVVALTL